MQTLGFRWGEGITGRLVADHAIHARWELWIDGERRTHGRIRTQKRVYNPNSTGARPSWRYIADKQPDNQRCVERPGELVTEREDDPPAPSPSPDGPAPDGPPITSHPATARPAAPLLVRRPTEPAYFTRTADSKPRFDVHGARFLRWSYSDQRLKNAEPLRKGRPMLLKIWSEQPQDWHNVRVQVQQFGFQPDVPEAEWLAHLEAKRAERERERAEDKRERAAKARAWNRKWQKKRAERAKRRAFCARHHNDEDCWGEGGLAGHRARLRKKREAQRRRQLAYRKRHAAYLLKQKAERARRAAMPKPPKTAPPAAKVEDPGPVPSRSAEWVDGFWQWSGHTWVWLSGWWKVPEVDIRAQATATAPTAPPPVRVEVAGQPPCVGAVWMGGHWVWRASAWVWLGGRWTLPPRGRARARWQASRWIKVRGGRVRLQPGRWLRAILR